MKSLRLIIIGLMALVIGGIVFINVSEARSIYSSGKALHGLHERKNAGTLRRAIGVNPARTPWCGAFVGYAVKRAGFTPPRGHLRAYNWTKFGKRVSKPRKGDIVVIRTRRGHHVTIYAGSSGKGRFKGLGGNQSNRVKVTNYRTRSIVSIRRAGKSLRPAGWINVKKNRPSIFRKMFNRS